MFAPNPRVTEDLLALTAGDTLRLTLPDGTALRVLCEVDARLSRPESPEDRLAGWETRFDVPAVHVEDADGTDYETLALHGFRQADEWGSLTVRASMYDEEAGTYLTRSLPVKEVEVL